MGALGQALVGVVLLGVLVHNRGDGALAVGDLALRVETLGQAVGRLAVLDGALLVRNHDLEAQLSQNLVGDLGRLGLLAAVLAHDLKDDGGLTGHDLPAIIAVFQADGVGAGLSGGQRMHGVRAIVLIVPGDIRAAGDGDVHIVVAVAPVVAGPLHVGIRGHGIAAGKQAVSGAHGGVRDIFVDTLHLHSAHAQQAGVALRVAVQVLIIRRLGGLNDTQFNYIFLRLLYLFDISGHRAIRVVGNKYRVLHPVYFRINGYAGKLRVRDVGVAKSSRKQRGHIIITNQIVIVQKCPTVSRIIRICSLGTLAIHSDPNAISINIACSNGGTIFAVIKFDEAGNDLILRQNTILRSAIFLSRDLMSKYVEVTVYDCAACKLRPISSPAVLLPANKPICGIRVCRVIGHVGTKAGIIINDSYRIERVVIAKIRSILIIEVNNVYVVVVQFDIEVGSTGLFFPYVAEIA